MPTLLGGTPFAASSTFIKPSAWIWMLNRAIPFLFIVKEDGSTRRRTWCAVDVVSVSFV